MSNIAVVPRFQNPWVLTSALDFEGTSTCPDLLSNTAALFTVRPLPPTPWNSPTMTAPPLAVPLYCRAPDPALPPCTVLLFIYGLEDIELGKRAHDSRAPHSFVASSCRSRTRPPFGNDRVCSINNLIPQPSQVAGMS